MLDQNIRSVQCLRGVAALMIVIFHLQNQLARIESRDTGWSFLQAGVDIFFVISGFIMWVTTSRKLHRSATDFYRDRITRIAPLYWLITAFLVSVMIVYPGITHTAVLDWPHIIQSILFFPAHHPVTHAYQPTLIPGWTLNLEMFFYLIFGAAIVISGMNLRLRGWFICVMLLLIVALGQIAQPTGVLRFYTQDIVGEFAVGIVIGVAFMKGWFSCSNWFWLPLLMGTALLIGGEFVPDSHLRLVWWGGPASLIVLGTVFVPQSGPLLMRRLGDWSYALYLSHPITLAAVERFWTMARVHLPVVLFAFTAIAMAVAASWIIHRFVEVPLTRATRSWFRPHRQGVAAPLVM